MDDVVLMQEALRRKETLAEAQARWPCHEIIDATCMDGVPVFVPGLPKDETYGTP